MSSAPELNTESNGLTWDVASLFPRQGEWSPADYLNLTDDLTQLVELTDGRLEILEMPTTSHQQIVLKLIRYLTDFIGPDGLGIALMAPLRVQVRPGLFREPDIVFALAENRRYVTDEYWNGADLVMEVVSAGVKSRRRDLEEKRLEYATAQIPEYWIVDPASSTIQVLKLVDDQYQVAGHHHRGETAESRLLPGFSVPLDTVFLSG